MLSEQARPLLHGYAAALLVLAAASLGTATWRVVVPVDAPALGPAVLACLAAAVFCAATVTVLVRGQSTAFTLAEAGLVVTLSTTAPAVGLLAFGLGSVLAHVAVLQRSGVPAVVTTTADVLAATSALLTAAALGWAPVTAASSWQETCLHGLVAAWVFGAVSHLVVAVAVALAEGERTARVAGRSLGLQVAVTTLGGALGVALVVAADDAGDLVLALVPAAAAAVLANARVREHRYRQLLDELLEHLNRLFALLDPRALADQVVASGQQLTRAEAVWLSDRGPLPGEIGAALPRRSGAPQWLVALPRQRQSSLDRHDQRVLTTLATAAATALDNAALHQQLSSRVTRDDLTGLLNRSACLEVLQHEVSRADRDGSSLGVLFLDLDGFKAVNDTLGHLAGDRLLRQAADRLRTAFRGADVPARLGGDEFAVVLPHVGTPAELDAACRRARAAFDEPFRVVEQDLAVEPSVGAALFPRDGRTDRELLHHADVAMMADKRRRRAVLRGDVPRPR